MSAYIEVTGNCKHDVLVVEGRVEVIHLHAMVSIVHISATLVVVDGQASLESEV